MSLYVSQVSKEVKRLEVVMPESNIPEWFHHVNEGRFPVFTSLRKFPIVVLALVFCVVDAKADKETMESRWRIIRMHLFIEGERRWYHNFSVVENHVLLCDL